LIEGIVAQRVLKCKNFLSFDTHIIQLKKVCARIHFARELCRKANFSAERCASLGEIIMRQVISEKFPVK